MRYLIVVLGACCLLLAGCGGREEQAVPAVAGERLDVAIDELDDAGLGHEVIGGGLFGVVIKSHWTVCEQHPAPGVLASSVELVVARACPPPYLEQERDDD